MDCESRRELALKELEKARKHFEKIYDKKGTKEKC